MGKLRKQTAPPSKPKVEGTTGGFVRPATPEDYERVKDEPRVPVTPPSKPKTEIRGEGTTGGFVRPATPEDYERVKDEPRVPAPKPTDHGIKTEYPTYTRTQFIQLQQEQLKDIRELKSGIEPTARYILQTESPAQIEERRLRWEKAHPSETYQAGGKIVTGTELLGLYEERHQAIRHGIVEIGKYPAETKFKKTVTGYEVIVPPPEQPALAKTPSITIPTSLLGRVTIPPSIVEGVRKFTAGILSGEFIKSGWMYQYRKVERGIEPAYEKGIREFEYTAQAALKKGGALEYAKLVAVSPPMTQIVYPLAGAALLGAGITALKQTAWAAKPLISKFTYPPAITKPISLPTAVKFAYPPAVKGVEIPITRGALIEYGIFGYGTYETGKALKREPLPTLGHLARTLPLMYYGYRFGATKTMGWIQRRGAMADVTGVSRVRQKAIYEATDIVWEKGKGIRPIEKPFDLARVERLNQKTMMEVSTYLTTEQKRWIFGGRPRIGGAVAMEMYGVKRTGDVPSGLRQWAIQRQIVSGRPRPMMGAEAPKDIDVWVRNMVSDVGQMRRAMEIRTPHVIDVPTPGYKPGRYYWGGWTELSSVKTTMRYPLYSQAKYLADVDIAIQSQLAMEKVAGRGVLGYAILKKYAPGYGYDVPVVRVSSMLVEPAVSGRGYQSYLMAMIKKQPVIEPVAKIPFTGKMVVGHELRHILFPKLSETQIRQITPRPIPELEKAITSWFETGKFQMKVQPTMKVKIPQFRELFMRKGVSILPSETKVTGYRSYKDPFDFYYMAGQRAYPELLLTEPKAATEFVTHISKIIYPEKYPIPKVTIGERIVGRMDIVKPTYAKDIFGIYPTYPKGTYPSYLAPVGYVGYPISKPYVLATGAYKISPYKPTLPPLYKPTYVPRPIPVYEKKYPTKKPISYTLPPPIVPSPPPYKPITYERPFPPSTPPSTPPSYTPYKPSKYPPGIPPAVPPPKTPKPPIYTEKKRKRSVEEKKYGLRYRFRLFTYPKIKTPKTIVPKSVIKV